MYYYIVNPNAGNGTFNSIQHKLKATLHDLNIDGEFAKTIEKNDARKITHSALKRGMKTVVVAGGDKTVNEVIAAVHESGNQSVSVGIIPLGRQNTLARFLGINDWEQACELLAARRLQSFNLIHVNDYSFIHSCHIEPKTTLETPQVLAEIDGMYKLRGDITYSTIINQKMHNVHLPNELLLRFHPSEPSQSWWSRIARRQDASPPTQLHARVAILEFSSEHSAVIDGRTLHNTLFRIRLSDLPVQLITAKQKEELHIDLDAQNEH